MFKVIAIDKSKQRHVADELTAGEYAAEGSVGCGIIARNFCEEHGLQYSNWAVETSSGANASQINYKVKA